MVEKRPLEDGDSVATAASSGDGANGASDGAKKAKLDAKPSLSLAALEKAKKALQLQKELKEKLKNLPQLQKPTLSTGAPTAGVATAPEAQNLVAAAQAKAAQLAARFGQTVTPAAPAAVTPAPAVTAPSTATGPGFKPTPLLLDSSGRQVDLHGNLVMGTAVPVTTLRVNQIAAAANKAALPVAPPTAPQETDSSFFDERMTSGLKKLQRKPRSGFDFVEEGQFQKQAEEFRLRARYGRDAPRPRGPIGPISAGGGGDPNQVPLGVNPNLMPLGTAGSLPTPKAEEPVEEVPDVEWWDKPLLMTGSYEVDVPDDQNAPVQVKQNKITLYVEHPVPIQPPAEGPPPPPQPLKLTARELKKLRTQRRQAREKEKQDLIRQGLLEPAKPKVKLSNLYRVLGEQAVADPTALEMETRKQMAERQAAHDDRNLSRALTPAERKEKKERKLFDDTGLEIITSVYKILRLDNPQNKYKVDVNAKENKMTGVLLITPDFTLVVVEGCNKSTKRYAKLMLRRIDWSAPPAPPKGMDAMEEDHEDEDNSKPPNRCDLVWQGLVKEAAFEGFKVEMCRTIEHAQQILTQRNVLHYWDAARNFVPGESVAMQLGP